MRVMFPVTLLSGFINNTPLVMISMPIVIQWARKIHVPLRFVLIPLSFAALLGGVRAPIDVVCWLTLYIIMSF